MSDPVLLKRLRDVLAVIASNADTLPPLAIQSLAALAVAAADTELEKSERPGVRVVRPS